MDNKKIYDYLVKYRMEMKSIVYCLIVDGYLTLGDINDMLAMKEEKGG